MSLKTCTPTTKICAMCFQWNGYNGGKSVKPKVNARNFWTYDSEEQNTCLEKHLITKAWNSCSNWQKKF